MRKHAQPPTMFDEPEPPQEPEPDDGLVDPGYLLSGSEWAERYLAGSMTLDDDGEFPPEEQAEYEAETERIRQRQELAAKGAMS